MNALITGFIKTILVVVSMGFMISSAQAANTFRNHGGEICRAINQNQAFDLQWDHYRILNTNTSTVRWIVCPIDRTVTGIDPGENPRLYVNTYWDTGADSSSRIFCIWRDIPFNQLTVHMPKSD